MATLFIDYNNGNDNFGGTSFATLATGTDGRITGSIFSAATANFPNNGTIAPLKNLVAYSELAVNTNYINNARTTTSLATIAPPTEVSSSYVWNILETFTTNTFDIRIAQGSIVYTLAQNYTFSCYVKANGRNQVVLRLGANATKGVRYNLTTGTVAASGASATGTISDKGNGWYRISITTTPDTTTDIMYIMLADDTYTGTTAQTYTGDITKGFYISAMQMEVGSSATTYEIPSTIQYLSIFNGTSYVTYHITNRISSTSLGIFAIPGGTALANQTVDRQYFIGGRWKTIETGATAARTLPADTIRIMSSPDPTLVGTATFTSAKADLFKTISSSTNTSPISITLNSHGFVTGDTVVVTGHITNTNANGTWEVTVTGTNTFTLNGSTGTAVGSSGSARKITNAVVRLSSSVTQNIASFGNIGQGRVSWTSGNANITTSLFTTDFKEGNASDAIIVGAGFTTGKAAYFPVSSLNLSDYQQVSFYIKQSAGTVIAANNISLALCSDSLGNTIVNTINIPGISLINRWLPITVDLGTNLGSNINSIALYINLDNGAQTFQFSNIIACKASSSPDSLNLQSLVGKNTSSEKWWAPIQSINGTRLILDQNSETLPNEATNNTRLRGYFGTSETTNLFKRETIKTIPSVSNANYTQTVLADGGYEFFPTKLQFGYDRTNMSSRTGETFFDGLNSIGVAFYYNARNYMDISNLGCFRYDTGFRPQGSFFLNANNIWTGATSGQAIYCYSVAKAIFTNIYSSFNYGTAVYISVTSPNSSLSNIQSISNGGNCIYYDYSPSSIISNSNCHNSSGGIFINHTLNSIIKNCICTNNMNQGIGTGGGGAGSNMFIGCQTSNNGYSVLVSGHGTNFVKNCILSEAVEYAGQQAFSNGRTIFINNDNSSNNYLHVTDYGTIYNTAIVRYSNSGFAWALAPTNVFRSATYPLDLSIAKIAVNANALVTVKAWMRRTNTLISAGLRIKGSQIAGVPNDIISYMTAPANTWQQVILTFTPTEVGVVEIFAECYGGTTYTAYVDDISITQV